MRLASLVFATVSLLSFLIGGNSIAGVAEEQGCNIGADYSLVSKTSLKQYVVTSEF